MGDISKMAAALSGRVAESLPVKIVSNIHLRQLEIAMFISLSEFIFLDCIESLKDGKQV